MPSISPVGDGADAEGQWFGRNMRTDYSKLDTAMAYARSKDLVAEKVNSTGNMKRGTQGPRGKGKGKDMDKNNFSFKKRPDLRGGSQRRSINMVQAGQAKFNQDKENRELEQLVPSNLDWDLLHQTKPQGSDVNSNQAPLEGNIKSKRTPERIGTSFGATASSTPSTSRVLPHQMGFKNYKNTCYMLAPFQVLQGIPSIVASSLPLASLVEEWEDGKTLIDMTEENGIKVSKLASPWSLLCQARQRGDLAAATTQVRKLKSAMGELSDSFSGNTMQDAHEFAAQFIDNLKEEVAKMKQEAEVQLDKEKVNPVVDNMEMEWEETLVCERCGVRTTKRKKEVGLFCSLGEDVAPTSLQDLIQSTAEPEIIDRTCEAGSCSYGKAEQSRRMTSLPRVLVIYLKRTAWASHKDGDEHEGENVKVTRVVDIPPIVSLDSIRASKCRLPSTVHSDPPSALPVEEPISPIKNLSINTTPSTAL